MVTPEEIDLAAEETCQSIVFVHLIAFRLKGIWDDFSLADLIGQVTLALEKYQETSN
ncbi:MAG: hypothetical protein M3198_16330 [Actinomycetota bacterium]|nr:hypothetical protein [Actinomycetota bacterium]